MSICENSNKNCDAKCKFTSKSEARKKPELCASPPISTLRICREAPKFGYNLINRIVHLVSIIQMQSRIS